MTKKDDEFSTRDAAYTARGMDHWFRTSRAQVRRHVSGAGQCALGSRRRCVAKADPVVRWLNVLFRLRGSIRVGEMNYREQRRRSSKTNVRGWSNKEAQRH